MPEAVRIQSTADQRSKGSHVLNSICENGVAPTPRWITEAECARMLGMAPRALEGHRYRGTAPPFTRIGKLIRYEVAAVTQWLRARQEGGAQ
jgi:hypothetical protein